MPGGWKKLLGVGLEQVDGLRVRRRRYGPHPRVDVLELLRSDIGPGRRHHAPGLANVGDERVERIGIADQAQANPALRLVAMAGVASVRDEGLPSVLGIAAGRRGGSRRIRSRLPSRAGAELGARAKPSKAAAKREPPREYFIVVPFLCSYVGCVTVSSNAGWPFSTTASARLMAGPTSLGFSIGPSAYHPMD